MSEAYLKFGGKIIEELSQKIPSTLFALNELIKNAYDAFSPDVTIKVNLSKGTVTISDNGNGMGVDEIGSLFIYRRVLRGMATPLSRMASIESLKVLKG
ncbi:TPA: sensor histidine kinase [Pseudomonas aeruginosa]|nr:sensor histidine kinase [Pseudomonas aeruginosa]